MARNTFAGFCLTAFACGIVTTVAIDRIWPHSGGEPEVRVEPVRIALPLPAPPPRPETVELTPTAKAPTAKAPTAEAPTAEAPTAAPAPPVRLHPSPTAGLRPAPTVGLRLTPVAPIVAKSGSRAQPVHVTALPIAPALRKRSAVEPAPLAEAPRLTKKWVDPFE